MRISVFCYGDPEQLADRLRWTLALSNNERARIGDDSREQVVAGITALTVLPKI